MVIVPLPVSTTTLLMLPVCDSAIAWLRSILTALLDIDVQPDRTRTSVNIAAVHITQKGMPDLDGKILLFTCITLSLLPLNSI